MAISSIPLDKAYLTAIWLETVFYGMNIVLFFAYLFIVRFKRKSPRVNKPILFVAIAMFCFSTIHVSLGFSRLIEGFVYLRGEPGGPAAFFSNVSVPANVAKIILHSINCILGDGIVVWRCYHVWGQKWGVCIIPIVLVIASAACGLGQGIMFAQSKTTHSAFASTLAHWNGSLYILSLTTNVLVTILIAARIWYLSLKSGSSFANSSFKYRRVLTLIVESGAIYSSSLIMLITLYFLNSNAFYIIYDPIGQLTAIIPTMIIVMTSLGLTYDRIPQHESTTYAMEFRVMPARMGSAPASPYNISVSDGGVFIDNSGQKLPLSGPTDN
ncbi:hypothetical protein BDZ94DRAFT_1209133 [Collybia nuda]|uniref:Uncharacterized protein n=1 Tax=Collybia nuda TaxID=64659 RepID=A0A9P5YDZ9_9AGAR|nr:hypothetical protein BDZ94DRAFT_1209133 [Collybia nuda]